MRTILRVTGPDREHFLQGLVTNDVRRAPVWAALLTPQGKYLADFFIVPDGESLLIDVDARLADDLLRRLSMYKLRSQVEIATTPLTVTRGTGPAPEDAIADPRHPALGWRLYADAPAGEDATDWDALRVAHLVPESLVELVPNESYPLEAAFERLHGVDFRKGCFVGQEIVARMKHKTQLRKGLMQVAVGGSVLVGTAVERDGREVGTLYTQSGGHGIAQMRFDRIGPGMTAGDAVVTAAPPA